MSNKNEEFRPEKLLPEEYIHRLEIFNGFAQEAIRQAIHHLGLFPGCEILDIPCGIGKHACWMLEENEEAHVTGVDISEEHLAYAKKLLNDSPVRGSISLEQGDMTDLVFADNTFDFVWCCNGLWVGDPAMGYLASEPYQILGELKRITKPGGKIALIYSTNRKFLPGHPLLESVLSATFACHYLPVNAKISPEFNIMRAPLWLNNVGLEQVEAKSFVADLQGPFSQEELPKMASMLDIFWGKAEGEISPGMWKQYQSLSDPDSADYIFRLEGYAGSITYTMFTGVIA